MTQIFIQQAQTMGGNVALIVLLLLVAAIIGYLTSWFYAKSVYTPVIKRLESEKEGLKTKITGLNDDKKKLEVQIEKLNEKIASIEAQIEESNKELKQLKKQA
jgi:septal ring factor EnvC (AmiA/AmiB activator)